MCTTRSIEPVPLGSKSPALGRTTTTCLGGPPNDAPLQMRTSRRYAVRAVRCTDGDGAMKYRSSLRDKGPCHCSGCDACEFNDLLACIEEANMWVDELLDVGAIDLREGLEMLNAQVF